MWDAYSKEGTYFKFWLIGGCLFKGVLIRGEALILGFTVPVYIR